MIINWYGEACFKIQSGETVILTDPFESSIGLTPPRFKADMILKTDLQHPVPYTQYPIPSAIGPGEYEIKEVKISGFQNKTSAVYLMQMEGMRICLLGYLKETLEPAALEKLNEIDLLFIPAGGKPFISQEEAAKLIKKITPKLAIASLFKIPGLKRKTDDVKTFLKEMEQKAEPQEKLTIKKKDLPAGPKVIVLKL